MGHELRPSRRAAHASTRPRTPRRRRSLRRRRSRSSRRRTARSRRRTARSPPRPSGRPTATRRSSPGSTSSTSASPISAAPRRSSRAVVDPDQECKDYCRVHARAGLPAQRHELPGRPAAGAAGRRDDREGRRPPDPSTDFVPALVLLQRASAGASGVITLLTPDRTSCRRSFSSSGRRPKVALAPRGGAPPGTWSSPGRLHVVDGAGRQARRRLRGAACVGQRRIESERAGAQVRSAADGALARSPAGRALAGDRPRAAQARHRARHGALARRLGRRRDGHDRAHGGRLPAAQLVPGAGRARGRRRRGRDVGAARVRRDDARRARGADDEAARRPPRERASRSSSTRARA